ncbi:hypothetical protein Tco_0892279 [Tanacetum coccineum]|uniref:Uncharacterized protein n=1 Tax=Tanacetum coccineum TaxID=301880 RepID=A0ABQ5C7A5_9ASTR
MAANQAIEYAHQCGDLTVESLDFHNNNVVGIFNYPQTTSSYHDICKYLMNCPLVEAFTKTPLVVYQNFLREFWCTAIAYDPNPPENNSEARPLKEYLIKLLVMNGKKPLILDYKTFFESTRLDYAKGKYVSHPSTEEVKAELAKIVLGENYSSTKQVNSIQQLFAYCLLTGIKVDIGEIIYSDLVTRLISKSRQKFEELLGVLLKGLVRVDWGFVGASISDILEGPSSPRWYHVYCIKDFEFIDPEKNIQLTGTRLPSILDEGTRKSQPFLESTNIDPKDLGGNVQPTDKGLPSMVSNEGTVTTTSLPEGPLRDKDLEGNKTPADMELINPTIVDLSGIGAKYQVDETQSTRLRYQTLTGNKGKTSYEVEPGTEPLQLKTFADVKAFLLFGDELTQESDDEEVSRVLFTRITEEQWAQHEEADVFYADLKASIKGYYEENIDHMDHTDKVIDAAMNSLDKNSITRGDLLNSLNGVTEILKSSQDVVKQDRVLNKKVTEATKAYIKNSTHLTELLTLIKNFDFQGSKSLLESLQATALSQDKHLAEWAKSSTSMAWSLGPRMTVIENS